MTMNEIYNNYDPITLIKRKLISQYVLCFAFLTFLYLVFFYFLTPHLFFVYFILAFFCAYVYTAILLRKNYKIDNVVHLHLITAPIVIAYVLLSLWETSISTLMYLLPVPLGAYIFFNKKYVYLYSAYIIFLATMAVIISDKIPDTYKLLIPNRTHQIVSDFFTFGYNVFIIFFLLNYKDKLNKAKQKMNNKECDLPVKTNHNDKEKNRDNIEKYLSLFNHIHLAMEEKQLFKNASINMSKLSAMFNTNNVYCAKAIRLKGYSNFNHFINTYRIEYAKKLISEQDLGRITMMYIYTEAGFCSQSTFNRTFKQIEGMTPSEYINMVYNVEIKTI